MGFRFRKSINLGKGFRINLSKSGPGFSWGGPGFRLTRTAKGNIRGTAYIPGTGMSYQKEFSNPFDDKKAKKATNSKTNKEIVENKKVNSFQNDLKNIKTSDMSDILQASKKNQTNNTISLILILAGLGLGFINPILFLIALCGVVFFLYNRGNQTIRIDYEMSEDAKEELDSTNKFLEGIMESDEVFLVNESVDLDEDNPADMKIIDRTPLTFKEGNDEIQTNVKTYTLEGANKKIIFLPDSIFIKDPSGKTALSLKEVEINLGKMTFLEEGDVAYDATVIGKSYQHLNKDGSKDKRYKDNPELTLVDYGILSIFNQEGLNLFIVFSDTVLDGK